MLLEAVDLELRDGETLALIGESGCGKTMAALALMRLLPPAARIVSGQIRLGKTDLAAAAGRALRSARGGRIAMVFQEPQTALSPVLTVGRQIAEVVELHTELRGARGVRARVLELLGEVGLPEPSRCASAYPHQLSGGMKQRAMIAMALAGQPEVLIADEPTTALDVTLQAEILALLRQLQRRHGMAMLLITHDFAVAAETANRLAVMYAGQIVESAPSDRFFREAAHPYSRGLLASRPTLRPRRSGLAAIPGSVPPAGHAAAGCRFAARCDRALAKCHGSAASWARFAEDHWVRCHRPAATPLQTRARPLPAFGATSHDNDPEPLVELEDLAVHFPVRRGLPRRTREPVRAVDGVSLKIRAGRTLALVGESGCGKTTVGKALLRLAPLTGGVIRYRGRPLTALSKTEERLLRKDLQIVFQDPFGSMNPRMHVGDIVAEGLITLLRERPATRRRRVAELLESVGLAAADMGRYPHEFSGGQRQRIAIARALAVEPRLIVCDEPTSALDVSVQAQILNLMRQLQQETGIAYLLITHDLAVVSQMADEVAVMYRGRIVESGSAEEVLEEPRHPYTQTLLSAVPQKAG